MMTDFFLYIYNICILYFFIKCICICCNIYVNNVLNLRLSLEYITITIYSYYIIKKLLNLPKYPRRYPTSADSAKQNTKNWIGQHSTTALCWPTIGLVCLNPYP